MSANGVDFSDATAHQFDYLKEIKILGIHPPFVLLGLEVTVTLSGENYFDNSDTGLLYVRLTRELSNDKDEKLVHVHKDCRYDAERAEVTFNFPSGIFDD